MGNDRVLIDQWSSLVVHVLLPQTIPVTGVKRGNATTDFGRKPKRRWLIEHQHNIATLTERQGRSENIFVGYPVHHAGIALLVAGADQPDDIRQLIDAGVDGLFTESPAQLQSIIRNSE